MNYSEFASMPRSEKIVLATIEAKTQFKVWTFAGMPFTFYKDLPYFVKGVKVDGVDLVEKANTTFNGPTSTGQFFYDQTIKRLYVRMPGDTDPKTENVIVTYKMFFSTGSVILPHNLSTGLPVEWDGRIESIGSLGQQLDDENTGIVLESSSNISLINNDGYFDSIFDTLIWENQQIDFYSWSPSIPVTEAKRLFSGVIESKSFDDQRISFKVKDFVYRLKNQVNLSVFSEADGTISPSILGTPKRRIYGQVKQVQCVATDATLGGFPMMGTITVSNGSTALTGDDTEFLKELTPGDEIFVNIDGETIKFSIDSVTSDTAAVLGDLSEISFTDKPAIIKPAIPYRFKNRIWHIAGHKLREPIATILYPTSSRRMSVDTTQDFFAGDNVIINTVGNTILRISGNEIVLEQSVFPLPDIGSLIEKSPVSQVYFKDKKLVEVRDWTLFNTTTGAYIELSEEAERNLANTRSIGVSLTFTNASRTITTSATIDLRTILKSRDWVKKDLEATWYEVLDVQEQTIILRTPFSGTPATTTGKMKNVDLIDDDSLITVNCSGLQTLVYPFEWVKTASDVVKHLITNDAGFTEIDTEAFAQAKADCPHIISMVIPESIGSEAPLIRDVITKVNESVFGSLYGNQSMELAYSILNARKPTNPTAIKDHDILSWDSVTDQKIVNKVKINYRPFTDLFSGSSAFETVEYSSSFVDDIIGIKNTDERTVYLYEDDKALIMAQRIAFFKSLSNCKISIKGKLNLALLNVNDKMYLEFDRLFKRYGGQDNKKIGIITGIKKNGTDVDVELTDLGNIFNRIPVIAPNTTDSYSTATREDAVLYGFIVDNDTLTPNDLSEVDFGNNRIG